MEGPVCMLLIPLSSSLLPDPLFLWFISVLMCGSRSKLNTKKIVVKMSKKCV